MVGGLTSAGDSSGVSLPKIFGRPRSKTQPAADFKLITIEQDGSGITWIKMPHVEYPVKKSILDGPPAEVVNLEDRSIQAHFKELKTYEASFLGEYGVDLGEISLTQLQQFMKEVKSNRLVRLRLKVTQSAEDTASLEKYFRKNESIRDIQGISYTEIKECSDVDSLSGPLAHIRGYVERNRIKYQLGAIARRLDGLTIQQTPLMKCSTALRGVDLKEEDIISIRGTTEEVSAEERSKLKQAIVGSKTIQASTYPPESVLAGAPTLISLGLQGPQKSIQLGKVTKNQDPSLVASLFSERMMSVQTLPSDYKEPDSITKARAQVRKEFKNSRHYSVLASLAIDAARLEDLKELRIDRIDLSDPDEQKALLEILCNQKIALTSLSLTNCNLTDEMCRMMVEAMMDRALEVGKDSLESLDLSSNHLQDINSNGLKLYFSASRTLKEWFFQDNAIPKEQLEVLDTLKGGPKKIEPPVPSKSSRGKGSNPSEEPQKSVSDPASASPPAEGEETNNEARKAQPASQVTLPSDASQLEKDLYAQNHLWTVNEAIERAGSVESCGVVVKTPDDWKRLLKHILPINEIFKKIIFLRFGQNSLPSRIDSKVLEAFRNNESIIEVVGIDAQQSLALIRSYAERNRLRTTEGKSWFIREGEGFDYKSVFEKMPADLEAIEIQFSGEDASSTEGEEKFKVSSYGIPLDPRSAVSERLLLTHLEEEREAVKSFGLAIKEEAIIGLSERALKHDKYRRNQGTIGEKLKEAQSTHALAYLSTHLEELQHLRVLSLNGIKLRAVDLQALVHILSAPNIALSSLFITEAQLGDPECQVLVEAILDGDVSRKKETLTLIDLSDNQLGDISKSGISLLLRCKKGLRSIGLSRNPLLKDGRLESLRGECSQISKWHMDNFPNDKREDVRTQLMPRTLSVEGETIGEHTRRRLGAQFSHLLVASEEQSTEALPLADEGDKGLQSKLEEEVKRQLGPFLERMQVLQGSLKTGSGLFSAADSQDVRAELDSLIDDVEADALIEQVQGTTVEVMNQSAEFHENLKVVSQGVKDSEEYKKYTVDQYREWDKDCEEVISKIQALEEEVKKLKDTASVEGQQKEISELKNRLEDLEKRLEPFKELQEIERLEDIEYQRGMFLQQNTKFRYVFARIVTRLKNDMIGRAAIASGRFSKEAFSSPVSGRGATKKISHVPVVLTKIGASTGLRALTGIVGAACGIAAEAGAGATYGASLALEVIPVALSLLRPVVTTAVEFGCGVVEKIGDKVIDTAFEEASKRKAKREVIALSQAGSITHQDQLHMDLAFGFVFLWQSQIEFLRDADAIKFADAWVNAYLAFVDKNASTLSNMIADVPTGGSRGKKLLLSDLSPKEIPNKPLRTIFREGRNERHWADSRLDPLLNKAHSKSLTTRALMLKSGVRYQKEDGSWVFYSADPDLLGVLSQSKDKQQDAVNQLIRDKRLTRAWLYGYRTCVNQKQADAFIRLQHNPYLSYGSTMIDLLVDALLTVPAHVTHGRVQLRKDEKLSYSGRNADRRYVLSPSSTTAMGGKPNQVFAISPAIQRFGAYKRRLKNCFAAEPQDPEGKMEFLAKGYLEFLLEENAAQVPLFEYLDKHPDQLRWQLKQLIGCDTKTPSIVVQNVLRNEGSRSKLETLKGRMESSKLPIDAVVERILRSCLQARMDTEALREITKQLAESTASRNESPFIELINSIDEKDGKEGILLIPFTLKDEYDWVLGELRVLLENGKYRLKLFIRSAIEEVDPEVIIQEITRIIGPEKITKFLPGESSHTLVEQSVLTEIANEGYAQPISYGVFIGELIRCRFLFDRQLPVCKTKQDIRDLAREHQRLIRYYRLIGSRVLKGKDAENYKDRYPDAEAAIAQTKDVVWQSTDHPIGPPFGVILPYVSTAGKIKGRAVKFDDALTAIGERAFSKVSSHVLEQLKSFGIRLQENADLARGVSDEFNITLKTVTKDLKELGVVLTGRTDPKDILLLDIIKRLERLETLYLTGMKPNKALEDAFKAEKLKVKSRFDSYPPSQNTYLEAIRAKLSH